MKRPGNACKANLLQRATDGGQSHQGGLYRAGPKLAALRRDNERRYRAADSEQEQNINREPAIAHQTEADNINCMASPPADHSHDPNERTNDEDRKSELQHRPGNCAEKNALRLS